MRLHFVTAAEAIPRHCNMARLWAFSIRRFGGAMAQSDLSVVFNERAHEPTARLLEMESGVRVSVRPRISRLSPHANKYNALHVEGVDRADFAVLTDADIACAHDLAPLACELEGNVAFGAAGDTSYSELAGGGIALPVYGYDKLLRELVPSLTKVNLDRLVHPWFDGVNPYTRLPQFNGGMMCVRTDRLPEFRERVLVNTERLCRRMSYRNANPVQGLKNIWNSQLSRRPALRRFIVGWFFPRGFSDQIALLPTVLQLNMPFRVLPHAYNWRHRDTGHGDDSPPRLIHYYQLALGLDVNRILDSDWLDEFDRSHNPGQRDLARVARAYLEFTKEPPVR